MAATSGVTSQSSFIETPSDTGELTSYLSMVAKQMYLQGKSEELLRLPKPLTLVLATKLSMYALVTIFRTEL